jgi:hypothetical protein
VIRRPNTSGDSAADSEFIGANSQAKRAV